MHTYMEPATGAAYCGACGWEGDALAVESGIADFGDRVAPGEICPVGVCPECGALAHLKDEETSAPSINSELFAFLQTVARGNTEYGDLEAMARELLAKAESMKARVLVAVSGGVAEFECFGAVDVEVIDFDNLREEGMDREARDAEYQKCAHWLKTGEVPEESDVKAEG